MNSKEVIIQIKSILQSQSLSENKIELQLQSIYQKISKQGMKQIEKIKNIPQLQIIFTRFNNFNTKVEKILLDIIEIFINYGFQLQQQQQEEDEEIEIENVLLKPIIKSGLLAKIKDQIKDQIEVENLNKKDFYSNELEQFVRIFLNINQNQKHRKEIINSCARILYQNIEHFIDQFIRHRIEQEDIINLIFDQKQIEEDLRRITLSVSSINLIGDDYLNDSQEIANLFRNEISQFIHINCHYQLQCQDKIKLPSSLYVNQFQAEILYQIMKFSKHSYQIRKQLQNEHNFLLHLSPMINFFTKSNKLQNLERNNRSQQIIIFSPSIILFSLKQIYKFLTGNHQFHKQAFKTPNFISSLINILKCKPDQYVTNAETLCISEITSISLNCLNMIPKDSRIAIYSHLSKDGYIGALFNVVAYTRDYFERNQFILEKVQTNIKKFLSGLYWKRNLYFVNSLYQQFKTQKNMIKSCYEQIEEEGGNEEIVSQFIIKRWKVRCDAHTIYRMILRCYSVNKKRIKIRRYHDDYDDKYKDFYSSSDSSENSCSSSSSDSSTSIQSFSSNSRKSFLSWDSALDMIRDRSIEYDFESSSGYESDSSSDSD